MLAEASAVHHALLDQARTTEKWRRQAACDGADLDLFFPVNERDPNTREAQAAKTYCGRCPVRQQCLDWAAATGQRYGIFGGLTGPERAHPTDTGRGRA